MSKLTIIYCPQCGEPCGREYPPTGPTYDSGGEEGFAEGVGENFSLNGTWHCSQACLDIAKSAAPEEKSK